MSENKLRSSIEHTASKKSSTRTNTTHISYDSLFSTFELSPQVKICIIIPVKNEEAHIVKTLTAFLFQLDVFGAPFDFEKFEILILANNCTDNCVKYIKDFQRQYPRLNIYLKEVTLPPHQANIGYARRVLMESAYTRLSRNCEGIIMTTDGDTCVAKDWIAQTQLEIEGGADAVGGRILLCPDDLECLDESTYLLHFKDEKYHLLVTELESKIIQSPYNPAPTHHQHFNGSFAVTTKCYAKSGGIPDVDHLEDCAFFERLQRIDARVRHSNKVIVHTSARYTGRTEVGLSYQLNVWRNLGKWGTDFFVESCASIFDRLIIKKRLLNLWKFRKNVELDFYIEMKKIAPEFKIDESVYDSFKGSIFFGEWYAQIIKLHEINWREKYPYVPIDEAIIQLQCLIADYSAPHFSQTSIR